MLRDFFSEAGYRDYITLLAEHCSTAGVALEAIRTGERTGRPVDAPDFVARLKPLTGRTLAPQ